LLSEEATYKTAASNLAAIFEAAESDEQLAPLGKISFAGEEFAEDDSVAAQKHPARGFEGASAIVGVFGKEQRPTTGAVTWTRGSSDSLPGAALGIDECAQIVETIRCEQTGSD
jgi:hypothetical protein